VEWWGLRELGEGSDGRRERGDGLLVVGLGRLLLLLLRLLEPGRVFNLILLLLIVRVPIAGGLPCIGRRGP
jgi:hypothetical protein